MKRIFVILGLYILTATMVVSAQCVEVKGVETRKKLEPESEMGFVFSNKNNYTVTIEAELRRPTCDGGGAVTYVTIETKSFVLDVKEEYVWKAPFWFRHADCGYMDTYVVFKVFKCP